MRAFVASDDPSLSFRLREALTRLGHECPSSQVVVLDAAVARLLPHASRPTTGDPELIVVIISPDIERGLSVLRGIRRATQAPLFAVGPAIDPKLLLRTLREGAQEYLDESNLPEELAAAIDRLKAEQTGNRSAGKIVALAGAAGGCGCSTLSVNVAAALAKGAGGCILLDLNSEAGDLSSLVDLRPTYTLADLCRNAGRLDRSLLEGALVRHASGIRLLGAPPRLMDAASVTVDGVRQILSLSTELAPFVVADLGRSFRRESSLAATQADEVWLVLRLDFTSLRNARRLLDHFKEGGLDADKVRVVVNRYRQPSEIPLPDAEAALGMKISRFVIDDAKTVNRANNNGSPVVIEAPSAKVSVQMADLAAKLRTVAG